MVSAVFTGIVPLRVVERRTVFDCAMIVVVASCLFGSGLRGAGKVAIAVACSPVALLHSRLVLVIGVRWAELLLAVANIAYPATTGNDSIRLLRHDINFTERSFIWHYAFSLWSGRPYLGFGLNGLCISRDIYNEYLRLHGWVLDNYHSSYMSFLFESGLVGFVPLARRPLLPGADRRHRPVAVPAMTIPAVFDVGSPRAVRYRFLRWVSIGPVSWRRHAAV